MLQKSNKVIVIYYFVLLLVTQIYVTDAELCRIVAVLLWPGFVQTLESLGCPRLLLFRIPGLESPGKRHRSWKTMEIPGILKQHFWIFKMFVSSSH